MASSIESETEILIAKLAELTRNPPLEVLSNTQLRRRLRDASLDLSTSMQWPSDSVHLIAYGALYSAMARIGVDTKIFEVLASAKDHLTSDAVAKKTNVDPALAKRLLRFYQSFRWIKETGEDKFLANNVTKALVSGALGIRFYNQVLNPSFNALPEYFKTHEYKNPTNPLDSPWGAGYSTKEHPFQWLQSHPEHFGLFMQWLPHERDGLPQIFEAVPLEKFIHGSEATTAWVDVGSGLGTQSVGLLQKYPDIKGKVVIQDLPHVLEAAKAQVLSAVRGIESMSYDFFTPQPIQGAGVYYMRNIIHDYQDEQCKTILRNQISAMTHESVLLIDDIVLPKVGTRWRATMADMNLMCALAAKERSTKEWYALLESVGLKIEQVWEYAVETGDSVIAARIY